MRPDFSLDGYEALIRELRGRGYEPRGFLDAEPAERHLILRHDIDLSIDVALTLAEREQAIGVRSTYFVLMRSELYNPLSSRNRRALVQIQELGHAIGLHFDAALYGDDRAELEEACAEECRTLEAWLSRDVEVVSFHRPAQSLLDNASRLAGRRHAYEPRFFREMGYCSDSRGDWHHGHPLEHAAVAEGRALQLLTHPIWWVALPGESVAERLDRLSQTQHDRFRREIAANCEPYREALERTFACGGEES
jgi:hypothetical protein